MSRKMKLKTVSLILAVAMFTSLVSGCVTLGELNPTATITFSTGDVVVIRLYYDKAPNTVKNFISLAESGFYDGLIVHRAVKRVLVQMGDPNGDGTGDAGYYIKGECANNGYSKNDLSHIAGTVSMARSSEDYNTGSSQFFIMLADRSSSYDGEYAAFGKVTSGLEFLETLSKSDLDDNNKPLDEVSIISVTIETHGKTYGEPKTIAKD